MSSSDTKFTTKRENLAEKYRSFVDHQDHFHDLEIVLHRYKQFVRLLDVAFHSKDDDDFKEALYRSEEDFNRLGNAMEKLLEDRRKWRSRLYFVNK
jgi:hypothetical protein